ncbi:MAG: NYN domain-containing protein [Actinobacteria bacterium]|nr:NYN domain-containing protein [Actinomycetota bacterium]
MGIALHSLLSAAVEAARAALRDLDGDQVPNDLRRAAAASGTLPPPLARSVVKGLDQYGWLREQAAPHLGEAQGPRRDAAELFLERPEGWELRLAVLAARLGEEAGSGAAQASAGKERELSEALKAARAKARSVQKESAAAVAALEQRLAGLAAARRAEAAGEARGEADARKELQAAEAAAREASRGRGEAEAEARRLRQELKDERARRRREAAAAAETAAGEAWVAEPAALAERLDETALMARPAARSAGPARAPKGPGEPWRLPAGVLPDARAAVDWLLSGGAPAAVLVDGYNLGYLMAGERAPAPARARVTAVAQRLHTMGGGALRVTVVFDSDIGPAETPPAPGPVTVRFSEAGETADDEIVRLAAESAGPVVVVSNDRAVRERSEAHGALAIWSTALAAWAGSR